MRAICLLCALLGILVSFITDTVAHEAIIGGEIARDKQLPYQVSILYYGHGHDCSGGILSEYYVITAAHCVVRRDNHFDRRRIFVLAGTIDLHKTHLPAQTILVDRISIAAEYDPLIEGSLGDIAILKLRKPLKLSEHIKTLELPFNHDEIRPGEQAKIAGWGWDYIKIENGTEKGNRSDTLLRYADAEILNSRRCQQGYRTLTITEKHICARVKQRGIATKHGVCNGDSGSPLVHDGIIYGILSHSPSGCEERVHAGVYTRVSEYEDVIRDSLTDRQTKILRVRGGH